jgi:phosphosulfolactate synthase
MPNMYNFNLPQLPKRSEKPRESGLTMVMDKGLSLREAENFIEMTSTYVDIVKLGFGTSIISPNLEEKIALYQGAGLPVYFGGTLFEAFVARNMVNEFVDLLKKYKLTHLEISDGSLDMSQDDKCNYIRKFSSEFTVISEVGSKDAEKIIPPYKWIEMMEKEINAGVWKVIAEARESGNVGIFRGTGEIRSGLIEEILTRIPQDKIIWEAPQKSQQLWFIKQYGANVSLGNIPPNEVIPLETMRIGLRGDSFHFYLEK